MLPLLLLLIQLLNMSNPLMKLIKQLLALLREAYPTPLLYETNERSQSSCCVVNYFGEGMVVSSITRYWVNMCKTLGTADAL